MERFERQHNLRSNKAMQLKSGRVRTQTQVYLPLKSESLVVKDLIILERVVPVAEATMIPH